MEHERNPHPSVMADEILDTKGLNCPLPILKTKKALRTLSEGAVLTVLATDPVAPLDFKAFCAASGNELVSLTEDDAVFTFVIRKAAE